MTLELRDISTFQGAPDWNAVASSGIAGVLAKASEGNGFEDPQWQRNQAALLAPGPLVGGSYHFARPDLGNTPEAEADWYLSRHVAACFDPATPWIFALDAESAGGSDAWCKAFLARVQARTGYPCWFYSFSSWIQGRGISAYGNPLWLAWPDSNGPDVPTEGWSVVTMQQYGVARVPGISGNVDANRFFGSLDQLRALAGVGVHSGGQPVSTWDGSYPMPDPPPAGTEVPCIYTAKILDGARWVDYNTGADQGPAPVGTTVTTDRARFDGSRWLDRISGGVWGIDDSKLDGSDANHPQGRTPVTVWNEAHKPSPAPTPTPTPDPVSGPTHADFEALASRVAVLELAHLIGRVMALESKLSKASSDLA